MAAAPAAAPAAARATRLTFLVLGIVAAGWAPLVPEFKLRLGLDDAWLGLMLLGVGAGAFAVSPFVGFGVARLGVRALVLGGGLGFCALLPLLTVLPGAALSLAALLAFGACAALMDVGINAQAAAVEQARDRKLMSGFHGLFSLGSLIGAALMSFALHLGAHPPAAAAGLGACGAAVLLSQVPGLLPRLDAKPARLALPHGRLALIGALCFIGFMAEGVVYDWSAVLLRFSRGQDAGAAGLGYAAFSVAMTFARLTGDAVLRALPPVLVLRAGALVSLAGFLLMCAVPALWSALAGCALIGLGLGNVVPVLFSAAARTPGIEPGVAISAAAAPGYVGLLAGPAIIGLFANLAGLPMALAGAGLLLLAVAAAARVAEDRHA
jgi:predicted MFS family arabinose efflux permease